MPADRLPYVDINNRARFLAHTGVHPSELDGTGNMGALKTELNALAAVLIEDLVEDVVSNFPRFLPDGSIDKLSVLDLPTFDTDKISENTAGADSLERFGYSASLFTRHRWVLKARELMSESVGVDKQPMQLVLRRYGSLLETARDIGYRDGMQIDPNRFIVGGLNTAFETYIATQRIIVDKFADKYQGSLEPQQVSDIVNEMMQTAANSYPLLARIASMDMIEIVSFFKEVRAGTVLDPSEFQLVTQRDGGLRVAFNPDIEGRIAKRYTQMPRLVPDVNYTRCPALVKFESGVPLRKLWETTLNASHPILEDIVKSWIKN